MARRRVRDPHTKDPRSTLELIAKLLVASSYRVPVEGTGTKQGLQASDVAAALAYMPDRLAKETALTVIQRPPPAAIARLSLMAYREVVRTVRAMRPRPLDLREPADRWRLRLATYDAAYELVWPERRKPYADLAKAAKMRKASYIRVHRAAGSVLEEALSNANTDLGRALFAQG